MLTPPRIAAMHQQISELRRDIHAHPELSFEEVRTANVVAEQLTKWGIPFVRGLAKTGIVATIQRGSSRKSIGLRADMDALPLQEQNQFSHCSKHHGKMHACGHDGHTAMLLGAAQYLQEHGDFDGTVHLIFQPAEEGGGGAREMIAEGLFERFPCDAVFALHNWPGLATGTFATRPSAIMASSSEFEITIEGKGAHAAMPHLGADPLLAAAQLTSALQSIVSRNTRPVDAAVLSVTQFHAGGAATNIIPDRAVLGGTVRTFSVEVLDLIEHRMRDMVTSVAQSFACVGHLDFQRNYPPTINTLSETNFALQVMRGIVGDDCVTPDVDPTMGAEDFSYMLQAKPGCYAFIGNGLGDHRLAGHGLGPCMLHNPSYDFNDAIIPLGMQYWIALVEQFLAR